MRRDRRGFWWYCGLIFDEVSAGVFGGPPSLRWQACACRSFAGRLAMFAGQDVAGFQVEIEGLQWHGAVVIQILFAHGK